MMFFNLWTALGAMVFPRSASTYPSTASGNFSLVADYSGENFFGAAGGWTFFDQPDPTAGFVNYLDAPTAIKDELAGFIYNSTTNSTSAYLGVDHTNLAPSGRNSVRISSNASFSGGALFVADILHMPLGLCGTWGAYWLVGPDWPAGGEIDVVEGVNDNQYDSLTLHTSPGCATNNASSKFVGRLAASNCDAMANDNAGCGIVSPANATLDYGNGQTCQYPTAGTAFNDLGGAVYATLWTDSGISVYLFPHDHIPSDLQNGTPDPSSWTVKPLAHFGGSGCDFMTAFTDLSLVINTDLCGSWGGAVWPGSDCAAKHGASCNDFVANNPSAFAEAYWSFASIKVYQAGGATNTVPKAAHSKRNGESASAELYAPQSNGTQLSGEQNDCTSNGTVTGQPHTLARCQSTTNTTLGRNFTSGAAERHHRHHHGYFNGTHQCGNGSHTHSLMPSGTTPASPGFPTSAVQKLRSRTLVTNAAISPDAEAIIALALAAIATLVAGLLA